MILIVDDNEHSSNAIADVLQDRYAVRRAGTGADALRQLRDGPRPALVLLDVTLPDIDGYEVLRRIKSDPDIAAIPIIAIGTGSMLAGAEALVWQLGACDYIQKFARGPLIHGEELLQMIQRHLG